MAPLNKKREDRPTLCRKILPLSLILKKQHIFHLSSALDARNHLAPVTSERNILVIDIPVARFQSLYQTAFRYFPISEQPVRSHIVGKHGKQKLSKPQHYPKNIVFYSVNHSVIG